jgi:uncharacterized membrane protein
LFTFETARSETPDNISCFGAVGSIQNELNDFLQKPMGNHVSPNEDFG